MKTLKVKRMYTVNGIAVASTTLLKAIEAQRLFTNDILEPLIGTQVSIEVNVGRILYVDESLSQEVVSVFEIDGLTYGAKGIIDAFELYLSTTGTNVDSVVDLHLKGIDIRRTGEEVWVE